MLSVHFVWKRNSSNLMMDFFVQGIPWNKDLHPCVVSQCLDITAAPFAFNPKQMYGGSPHVDD